MPAPEPVRTQAGASEFESATIGDMTVNTGMSGGGGVPDDPGGGRKPQAMACSRHYMVGSKPGAVDVSGVSADGAEVVSGCFHLAPRQQSRPIGTRMPLSGPGMFGAWHIAPGRSRCEGTKREVGVAPISESSHLNAVDGFEHIAS